MTKLEIKRLGDLIARQKALCSEVHALEQRGNNLTEIEQRILAILRITFKSVDD